MSVVVRVLQTIYRTKARFARYTLRYRNRFTNKNEGD